MGSQKKYSAYPVRNDFLRKSLEREYSKLDLTIPVKPEPSKEVYNSKTSARRDSNKKKPTKENKIVKKGQQATKKVAEVVISED